jgi:RNA polymerase sigma-70 factor (ECF subfamily)
MVVQARAIPGRDPALGRWPPGRAGLSDVPGLNFPTGGRRRQSSGCVTEIGLAAPADHELVRLALGGDQEAFGRLVDRHRRAVYRTALVACGSAAEADDVSQDAFVAAYRSLAGYRGDAAVRTWLLTIAWRKGLDRRRGLRRWFRPRSEDDPGDLLDDLPAAGRSPDEVLADRELRHDVRRLLRSLPARLREVLLLTGSGEHSYADVAAILDIPVGTVKWRVSEARRLLRTKLAALGHRP